MYRLHAFGSIYSFSTDAFLALPTDILGLDYVIPSSSHAFTALKATAMIGEFPIPETLFIKYICVWLDTC